TGMAADSTFAGGRNPRLGRRLAAVLAIFAGSAVGAGLVSLGGLTPPLVVTGACILLVTVAYAMHPASQTVVSDAPHWGRIERTVWQGCGRPPTPLRLPCRFGAFHRRSDASHNGAERVCRSFSNCRQFGTPMLIYAQICQQVMPGLVLAMVPTINDRRQHRG